ncbi:MAG: nucleotidyltransferase domain-containing protein [Sphingomonas phyllosphaerae]
MRLEPGEAEAIRRAARRAFGPSAVVRLFGSRASDTRKGGDIDLHIEVENDIDEWSARARFDEALFAQIEEQKVDVVLHRRGRQPSAIDMVALRDGIVL